MSVGFPFSFEGEIDRFGVGRSRVIWYTVLFLPPALEGQLPFGNYPRLRVNGEIADLPVEGAWMPTGDGRRYFIVAPSILKGADLKIGSLAKMRFDIADQNAVDIPAELSRALSENHEARRVWTMLTPGRQRGLTHLVHSAKTDTTRARRVQDVIATLTGSRP